MMEQLSAVDKAELRDEFPWGCERVILRSREDQIQFLFRLEAKLERNDKRIVDPGKYESFGKCVCYLFPVDDVGFSDRL